jgi:hypothetical protein
MLLASEIIGMMCGASKLEHLRAPLVCEERVPLSQLSIPFLDELGNLIHCVTVVFCQIVVTP